MWHTVADGPLCQVTSPPLHPAANVASRPVISHGGHLLRSLIRSILGAFLIDIGNFIVTQEKGFLEPHFKKIYLRRYLRKALSSPR